MQKGETITCVTSYVKSQNKSWVGCPHNDSMGKCLRN